MSFHEDTILPPPPDGAVPVIHDREYRARAFYLGDMKLLVQGALRDQKPPGLFIPGDPDPLTIHHMMVAHEVQLPEMLIVGVTTHFEHHPHPACPAIIGHYDSLVGLSIARGFTHKVRELFGGPRGCAHTTALLQAMAPVAIQSRRGVEIHEALAAGKPHPVTEANDFRWERLIDTCHVWADDGEVIAARRAGEAHEQPLAIRRRRAALEERSAPP